MKAQRLSFVLFTPMAKAGLFGLFSFHTRLHHLFHGATQLNGGYKFSESQFCGQFPKGKFTFVSDGLCGECACSKTGNAACNQYTHDAKVQDYAKQRKPKVNGTVALYVESYDRTNQRAIIFAGFAADLLPGFKGALRNEPPHVRGNKSAALFGYQWDRVGYDARRYCQEEPSMGFTRIDQKNGTLWLCMCQLNDVLAPEWTTRLTRMPSFHCDKKRARSVHVSQPCDPKPQIASVDLAQGWKGALVAPERWNCDIIVSGYQRGLAGKDIHVEVEGDLDTPSFQSRY